MKKDSAFQFLKFALFSASAGIIQAITFTVLSELLRFEFWLANLTALVFSVLWNFTFNRKFTFKSAANIPKAMLKVALFYVVFTPASTLLGNFAVNRGVNKYITEALTMLSNFVLEFLYSKFVVYKGQENNREANNEK